MSYFLRACARIAGAVALLLAGCGAETTVVDGLANKGSSNRPQAVIAGPTAVKRGDRVTLDATGSVDPDGSSLTYAWTLQLIPSGSGATLSAATGTATAFTADEGGQFRIELIATNAVAQASDPAVTVVDVTGTGSNHPPVAVIAATTGLGIVTLDGTGSHDADGDPLTYSWSFKDATYATLLDANKAVAYLRAPSTRTIMVTLTVSDGIDDDLAYMAVTP